MLLSYFLFVLGLNSAIIVITIPATTVAIMTMMITIKTLSDEFIGNGESDFAVSVGAVTVPAVLIAMTAPAG